MGSTYDDVDDLELYTQVPPEPQLPAFSPEPTASNQLLVLVTLQRGKNGPEKKYDLSFGVDEGANTKMLIEKAMKMISDGARHFRVRRYHASFQEYVETSTEDPVQHMARYHIRYAGYDEHATLFSPPSTPRLSTTNRQAKDVQCIDLTDDTRDDAAPATPSDNNAMMPPPSTTLPRKRPSTGDSTPTSTKRIRPLLSKTKSDVQSQMPAGQPSVQSLGYQPLSNTLRLS
ncbi:hypothetical protein AAVH_26559 [Aphelenchoides avenae]|nr:hypothetical protein AAVH_26559 [Aphelenchus avenae]